LEWHIIGSLQKNKINKALKFFDYFQTIDSIKLADGVNKEQRERRKQPLFL